MGALDDAIRRVEADAASAAREARDAARDHAQDVERLQHDVDDFLRRMHAAGDPGTGQVAVGPGPMAIPRRFLRPRTEIRMLYVPGWMLFGGYGPALTTDRRWSELVPGTVSALDQMSRTPVIPPGNWRISSDGYHPLAGGLEYDPVDPIGRAAKPVTVERLELAMAKLLVKHDAR
jgi:hypothetical protein